MNDSALPFGRLAERSAAAVCVIALVALAGWISGARVLAWQWGGHVPMAPSTAIALLGLGGGLLVYTRRPAIAWGRPLAAVGGSLAALLGLLVVVQLVTGVDPGIEAALARTDELLGRIPVGRMSPITAVSLLAEGAALMALLQAGRRRHAGVIAFLLGLAAAAISLVVCMGYAYGAPLLYGGTTIPEALPTALSALLLGGSEAALAARFVPQLRDWSGTTLRGRLLRVFLPGALLLVFIEGWLDNLTRPVRTINPALWDSITALVVCGLIAGLTAWLAHRTGDQIEEARNALRESESRIRAITESAQDAILMMDPEGRITFWNPAAERIFGYSHAEATGRLLHELIVPPQYRAPFYAALETFRNTGQGAAVGRTLDLEGLTKDGSLLPVQLSLSTVRLHDGWYGVGVVRDVTTQRAAEDQRRRMEQRIQQTQKLESLGVLAGGIAHDFNNILTAVLGHADLALDEVPPASPARESLTEIATAARRAAELVRQMLAYSGKPSFALERVDLNALIEGMKQLLTASISKKSVLDLRLDARVPFVQADPGHMRQVVVNLLTNASEAMEGEPGVITVATGTRHCDESDLREPGWLGERQAGLCVQLQVVDTGSGMTAATQARVFEPFFTTKFTGRGLGLAAVLGIVHAHKGAIRIDSEPDRGTSITVLFPALDAVDEEIPEGALAAAPVGPDHGTVLLVDDEEQLRTLGSRMLGRSGYSVITAANGPEALAVYAAKHRQIDAVVLDLTMPQMDGAEVFERLRRINPAVRVILASGYSLTDVSARFPGAILGGVIQKPFTRELLSDALRKALAPGAAPGSAAGSGGAP